MCSVVCYIESVTPRYTVTPMICLLTYNTIQLTNTDTIKTTHTNQVDEKQIYLFFTKPLKEWSKMESIEKE